MDRTTTDSRLTLQEVSKQFEQWRGSRKKRERIPQHLWQAAAELCKTHPITVVCRRLHLSFVDLKKHMACGQDLVSAPMQFMQLDLVGSAGPWRLECERADGARLRLYASGQAPGIEHLLRQFFS
jgi:hypothetical protein